MKLQEAVDNYLSQVRGACSVLLADVCKSGKSASSCPPNRQTILNGYWFGEEELVANASHTSSLYRIDNVTVY
jgi:hypothetical protein